MIAHINTLGEEQSIKDHLYGTAKRAEEFAEDSWRTVSLEKPDIT